jgi:hypothetical protein
MKQTKRKVTYTCKEKTKKKEKEKESILKNKQKFKNARLINMQNQITCTMIRLILIGYINTSRNRNIRPLKNSA